MKAMKRVTAKGEEGGKPVPVHGTLNEQGDQSNIQ